MNQIHVLLSLRNTDVLLRHESYIYVLMSMHNAHVLLRHESDTCITCLYIMYMFC